MLFNKMNTQLSGESKNLFNDEGAQTSVLYSVLLLLIVLVGLTVIQIGQGTMQRIRFRQVSDSSCIAAATAFSSQDLPIVQVDLTHEYILLAHYFGESLKQIQEAAQLVENANPGNNLLSAYFSSSSFISEIAPYQDHMESICLDPTDPGIIPENFFEEFESLTLRNAIISGQQIRTMNCNAYGGVFSSMEQIIVPDSLIWDNLYPDSSMRGFFQISNMPSPRFFFLNAFPYASLNRRGRMISATFTPLLTVSEPTNPVSDPLKTRYQEACQALEAVNLSNQQRINQMKTLDPENVPEDLALLTDLWNAIIIDLQQWAVEALDLDLFDYSSIASEQVQIPIVSSFVSSTYGQTDSLLDLAVQHGIDTTDPRAMEESLSGLINLETFFLESTLELSIAQFQNQLISFYESLEAGLTITKTQFEDILLQLEAFKENLDPSQGSLSTLLSNVSEDMQLQLDEPTIQQIQSYYEFIGLFSENIQELYHQIEYLVQIWPGESQALIVIPSNQFFDQAQDYFRIPIIRLESN